MKRLFVFSVCLTSGIQTIFSVSNQDFINALCNSQAWPSKKGDFIADIKNKKIDVKSINITKMAISGIDFSGMDLSEINITQCSFTNVNFKETLLDRAKIIDTTFRNCQLVKASLKGTNLQGSNFYGGSLEGASIQGAQWLNSGFYENIKLNQMQLVDKLNENHFGIWFDSSKTSWQLIEQQKSFADRAKPKASGIMSFLKKDEDSPELKAYFHSAASTLAGICASMRFNFSGENLQKKELKMTCLQNVNFQNADLRDADLTDADLRGSNLKGAKLKGAKLKGVKIANDLIIDSTKEQDLTHLKAKYTDKKTIDLIDQIYYGIYYN